LDSITRRPTYLEVFPRGTTPVAVTVMADRPWVTIREGGTFSSSALDRRYWIDVDWAGVPIGRSEATITVQGGDKVEAKLVAIRATPQQERESRGAFGGLAGAFSVPVTGYRRSIAVGGTRWEAIPDFGRVAAAMSIVPVDTASFTDPATSPRLEYDVYLAEAGEYRVDLVTGPTLEVIPGRKLAIAVALDDQAAIIKAVFTPEEGPAQDFLGAQHLINTANNARTMQFTVKPDRAGRHILKIAMIDPTIVLQTIIISTGRPRSSFFGPPTASVTTHD